MADVLPAILGHRGGAGEVRYQNSTDAFLHALDNVDGFETDACRSIEGEIFLVHDTVFIEEVTYELRQHLDPDSQRRAGLSRLDEMSTEAASSLVLKEVATPIPRLRDVLKMMAPYPAAILNLELKGRDTATSSVAALRQAFDAGYIKAHQVIISSFNHAQLLDVRRLAPDLKVGALFAASFQPEGSRLYPWHGSDKNCYLPFKPKLLETPLLRELNPDFFNLENTDMTIENVERIRDVFPCSMGMTWWLPGREKHPHMNLDLRSKLATLRLRDFMFAIISDYPVALRRHIREFLQDPNTTASTL